MPTIIITARPLPAVADLIPPIPGLQVVGCGDVESHTAIEPPGAALGLAVYAAALGGVLSRLVGATGEPARLTVEVGAEAASRNTDNHVRESPNMVVNSSEPAGPRCPVCGTGALVAQTPAIPGPTGWGKRCRECGHRWSLDEPEDPFASEA